MISRCCYVLSKICVLLWWEQRQRSCMIFLFLFSVWNSSWYNSQRKYLIVSITTLSLFTHLLRSLGRSGMLCFACEISNSLGRRSSTNSLLNFSLSSVTNMQRRSVRSKTLPMSTDLSKKLLVSHFFQRLKTVCAPNWWKYISMKENKKREWRDDELAATWTGEVKWMLKPQPQSSRLRLTTIPAIARVHAVCARSEVEKKSNGAYETESSRADF